MLKSSILLRCDLNIGCNYQRDFAGKTKIGFAVHHDLFVEQILKCSRISWWQQTAYRLSIGQSQTKGASAAGKFVQYSCDNNALGWRSFIPEQLRTAQNIGRDLHQRRIL